MGSIIKLIVMILIVLFVVRLIMRLFSAGVSTSADHQRAIDLKPCAYCGTHVYEKQAVIKKGQVFCSAEHAQKYQ